MEGTLTWDDFEILKRLLRLAEIAKNDGLTKGEAEIEDSEIAWDNTIVTIKIE